ncbi:MAG: PAS domain-containing protein [Treponema sp.]|jgi:PAS domain S-box-containing protein|nr:PAS domain-containing protein [Treponema sp.]
MRKTLGAVRSSIEQFINSLNLGMRAKLIIIFVIIKVIPLILLTIMAWHQAKVLGKELNQRTRELTVNANSALLNMGKIAVNDSVKALNNFATDDIERISTDMARSVADFLYQRDSDILYAASLDPDETAYRLFAESRRGTLVKPGKWELSEDGKSWVPADPPGTAGTVVSSNHENDTNFRYRPPDSYETESRPLYLEMTFVDAEGNERIKVTTSPRMDKRLKNVADRRNTYVKAETYFAELKKLKPGEIYVSDVIGAYVPSRLIGMYNPENAAALGLPFTPEEEAYAGEENPLGKRFQGIIRWAAPVVKGRNITGYVTFALDHDHIMEFTDHATPMQERYTELASAYEGNYAFIWDYKCRSICHPRHHSIVGYNPETGEPEIPWLEETVYNDWQASGKPYTEFIKDYPTFVNQSRNKKPAAALTAAGLVGLDGRYLNHAPQCTGWFDLTSEGGSGSFLILWSGLWKLTTAAAIPYYTGHYGESKRGFGFVAIGAGFEDFERPARETEAILNNVIAETDRNLARAASETTRAIDGNLYSTAVKLAVSAGMMILLVVFIAIWMASVFTRSVTRLISGISRFRSGERGFRFNAPVKDEIGTLADSFDEMADSLVEGDRGPIVITDISGRVIYANEAGVAISHFSFDEMLARNYREVSIYPPDSPYDPVAALKAGKETEIFHDVRTGRHYKGNATYLTNREGEKIGFIITSSDVTEIIEEQRKIAEQKNLLDRIFSSSPDIIWYQNAERKILAANPRYASMFGITPEEIIGRSVTELLSSDRFSFADAKDREAITSRKPFYFEDRQVFADGHLEVLDTVLTPIFDETGKLIGLLGFGRDVSARVLIEDELRHTQEELEEAVRSAQRANEHKGDFLARMSHEIRTPMNAIIGMTGIVKKKLAETENIPKEVMGNIGQIEVSSRHLLGLLNDILDISKIEAGKIELSEEATDFLKLAETVVAIIRPRCEEKNIVFETRFDISGKTSFITDPLRLRQVLINLLGNAVKFTPAEGKIEFTITEGERLDGKVLFNFSVRDNGIGIPEESLAMLFRPFEQTNNSIARKYGGTGLGLAISRSIVQMFGGDITVKSREGEGSEFGFTVWFTPAENEPEKETPVGDARNLLAGRRALLVDDVEINRIIAVNLLEYTGITIDEAEDGEDALRIFGASPGYTYDIIYMDVQMPKMDGYEAAAAIRKLERDDAKTVPIVALTANAFREDIEKAMASGMNAHLAKPMDNEKVLEVTIRLLGTGHAEKQKQAK